MAFPFLYTFSYGGSHHRIAFFFFCKYFSRAMDLRTVNSDELNGAGFPRVAGCFIENLVWLTIPEDFKIARMDGHNLIPAICKI